MPAYDNDEDKWILPLVALRGLVVFPKAVLTFDVGREKSIEALEYATSNNTPVFLTSQENPTTEDPEQSDLYKMGIITNIKQIVRLPGNMARVLAEGLHRAVISRFVQDEPFYRVEAEKVTTDERANDSDEIAAYVRTAQEVFEQYAALSGRLAPEVILEILICNVPGPLADSMAIHMMVPVATKQSVLEELDDLKRLQIVTNLLYKEINILTIQKEIYTKVRGSIEQHQKEYFLKEQLKIIQDELGAKEGVAAEIDAFRERLHKAKVPEYVAEKLEKEFSRLEKMSSSSPESAVIRDYIDWTLDLPWSKKTHENMNLQKCAEILDKDHYGLEKVKERIVEFLAVRQNAPRLDAPILCLVGPPGVGKTSIARSVARALNRKYVRMSLGGVRDEAEIRGHRKTYVGAMPGRIIAAMKSAGKTNPLILLDEIDKMTADFRGNPASALLEVLDAEQNTGFRDHYIELPYDLSDVLFICTANTLEGVPDALRDRLEIIHISSYTQEEKLHIAKDFLLVKQMKKHGLRKTAMKLNDDVITDIILYHTKEAGVRQLERLIGKLCRKTVRELLAESGKKSVAFTSENLETYLGKRKYRRGKKSDIVEIGVAQGLAWTSVGGDTLSIEVNTMRGSGKFELTGNMGTVMKESAQAAISYIRSQSDYDMPRNFYKNTDIHIHIPEGAVPKDGPSAGITMATAMVSALAEIPVRNDVCMTGEITIRGRVLPIGGLKEKVLAAKSAGLSTVILPQDNESDLHELSDSIKSDLEFVLVKDMGDVLSHALMKNSAADSGEGRGHYEGH